MLKNMYMYMHSCMQHILVITTLLYTGFEEMDAVVIVKHKSLYTCMYTRNYNETLYLHSDEMGRGNICGKKYFHGHNSGHNSGHIYS